MSSSKKHILLVEDEAIIALREKQLLEQNGYRVTRARSAQTAIQKSLGTARIDLILMDINLGPGMDGTEAARRILYKKEIPVVFLSSYTDPDIVRRTEDITSYGYIVKDSGDMVLLTSIKMVFKIIESRAREREGEKLLKESDILQRTAINSLDVAMHLVDTNMQIRLANRQMIEWCRRVSINPDIIGKKMIDIFPFLNKKIMAQYRSVMKTGKPVVTSETTVFNGKPVITQTKKIPVKNNGSISGVITIMTDITVQKQEQDELQLSQSHLNALMENTSDYILISDKKGFPITFNKAYKKIMKDTIGLDMKPGIKPHTLLPDKKDRNWWDNLHRRVLSGEKFRVDFSSPIGVDNMRHFEFSYHPIYRNKKITGFTEISRDITERKEAEDRITDLLREMQHRAKNSFTLITGMLSLMENAAEVPEAKKALKDIGIRVSAISNMYDLLYTTNAVAQVRVDQYLENVTRSMILVAKNISLETKLARLSLPVKDAIALGLISTEIITNSIKHAFPDEKKGKISISLKKKLKGYTLEIRDNGKGMNRIIDPMSLKSLGFKLIYTLAEQLTGRLTRLKGSGTGYRLTVD